MSKQDVFEKIVADLVDTIESGNHGKWEKPWLTVISGSGLAENPTTGHKGYHGMNQFVLMLSTAVFGYSANVWATYRQWKKLGGQVRKGEAGTTLVKWGVTYRCSTCDHKGSKPCDEGHDNDRRMWASAFTVFNVDQQDGWEIELPDLGPAPARFDRADRFIEATGAKIVTRPQDQAYYQPGVDTIYLPLREQFDTTEGYYGTVFHELTHWTGSASRLDREGGRVFGDEKYGGEELVAEIGSAFLAAHFGIEVEPHPDHASYLASWLERLTADPRALYSAAKAAEDATAFLVDLSEKEEAA